MNETTTTDEGTSPPESISIQELGRRRGVKIGADPMDHAHSLLLFSATKALNSLVYGPMSFDLMDAQRSSLVLAAAAIALNVANGIKRTT